MPIKRRLGEHLANRVNAGHAAHTSSAVRGLVIAASSPSTARRSSGAAFARPRRCAGGWASASSAWWERRVRFTPVDARLRCSRPVERAVVVAGRPSPRSWSSTRCSSSTTPNYDADARDRWRQGRARRGRPPLKARVASASTSSSPATRRSRAKLKDVADQVIVGSRGRGSPHAGGGSRARTCAGRPADDQQR